MRVYCEIHEVTHEEGECPACGFESEGLALVERYFPNPTNERAELKSDIATYALCIASSLRLKDVSRAQSA